MSIKGKVRENTGNYTKHVGIMEATVAAINPTSEWLSENGVELKEDSKMTEYLGEKDGISTSRVTVWLKNKEGELYPVSFFLENRNRLNQAEDKMQYINTSGVTTWVPIGENGKGVEELLPEWFTARDFKPSFTGEEELYNFLRNWLNFDWRDAETSLDLDRKKLFKGVVKEISEFVGKEESKDVQPICCSVEIKSSIKDGEKVEYQNVNNKYFLPGWCMKFFRAKKFDNETIEELRKKERKYLKNYEKFVVDLTDKEHGTKNFYSLLPLHEYNGEENPASSDKVIVDTDSSY